MVKHCVNQVFCMSVHGDVMTRFILIDFFILLPYAGESTMLHVHNIHRMYMCYCTTGFGTRPLKDRATTVRNEAGPS